MKLVEVLIPFHMNATNTDHKPGDTIEVSEVQLAKIRAVNVNMVSVIADITEPAADVTEPAADVTEPAAEPEKKQRKPRKPKQ